MMTILPDKIEASIEELEGVIDRADQHTAMLMKSITNLETRLKAAEYAARVNYDGWQQEMARSSGHAQRQQQPVAYVPLSKAEADKGEPIWREVFAAKWLEKDMWRGFDLLPLYGPSDTSTDREV